MGGGPPRVPRLASWVVALLACPAALVLADDFTYAPPGQLESGGAGREDDHVYVPGMRFPIEVPPAYANSQIYGVGGMYGPSGSQCDARNYAMPWFDNYCEHRAWDMPLCPAGTGHQGQDIRPATCVDKAHRAVAAEAGTITFIGTYSVSLTTPAGTIHRYLHMDPPSLLVSTGNAVAWGAPLGYVSNAFGDSSTTIHLHYDIRQNVADLGVVFVPTYMSLVRSYEALTGLTGVTCEPVPPSGATLHDRSACLWLHGPPQFWRFVEGEGYGGTLRWTRGFVSTTPSNWAEWRLTFEQAGDYHVLIHNVPEYGSSEMAPWAVFHDGVRSDVVMNLAGKEGWLDLGTFHFAEGAGQSVAVFDNSGEDTALDRRISADAIRIVPAWLDAPDGGHGSDGGAVADAGGGLPAGDSGSGGAADAAPSTGSSGGCASTGATPVAPMMPLIFAALLLSLVLARRRSRH
jgi:murein DD-endopeptidase MepM/ murein hydrolase activator NlpD